VANEKGPSKVRYIIAGVIALVIILAIVLGVTLGKKGGGGDGPTPPPPPPSPPMSGGFNPYALKEGHILNDGSFFTAMLVANQTEL